MKSTKSFPPRDWLRWPVVCPATNKHSKVRMDDQGRLWELDRASWRGVKVRPFVPSDLIDMFKVYECNNSGGQRA